MKGTLQAVTGDPSAKGSSSQLYQLQIASSLEAGLPLSETPA